MNAGDDNAVWNALAAYGLPLGKPERSPFEKGGLGDLPGLVFAALRDLEIGLDRAGISRKRECLAAFLLALQTGFPSYWAKWFAGSPMAEALLTVPPNGRVLKRRRVALARLAEIL